MPVGFRYEQRAEGVYHLLSDPGTERPLSLDFVLEMPLQFYVGRKAGSLSGRISAEGYAENAEIDGLVKLHVLERRLDYDFSFVGIDGAKRRFHAESEFDVTRPFRTLEEIVGRFYNGPHEEARVIARTPLPDGLSRILRTVRPDQVRER